MLALDKITQQEYDEAVIEPLVASYHGTASEVNATYIAEMVRQDMVERFGDDAYTKGYRVYTTIESERQLAANNALQKGLLSYTRDHGWRKPAVTAEFIYVENDITDNTKKTSSAEAEVDWPATFNEWLQLISQRPTIGLISPAIVSRIEDEGAWVYNQSGEHWLSFESMLDRKSTRLNSSHVRISYAVFCLK